MDTVVNKLRSMPMPVTAFGETVKGTVATGVLETATLSGQTVLGGQREMVAVAESFRKVILALPERNRVALTYWAAGMFGKSPRKTVSVCRRIRSTVSAGFRLTVVEVPEDVVNLIDAIVTGKVRSEGLAGRVSATMVTAPEPLPVPPQ